jgi:ABC-type antimicrobial peptide transport system permease subunit
MHIVLKEGALLAVLGVGIGVSASFFFSGLLSGMLHDVRSTDPGMLGFVALLLTLVALLASAVPAWRASEIDPVQALWEE